MSNPVDGVAITSRCALFILGMSMPLLVETISSRDEGLGVVVPIPAAPVEGKMFV